MRKPVNETGNGNPLFPALRPRPTTVSGASRQKQIPSSSKRDAKGGVPPAAEADLNPWPAPFDKPFHLILNLAVGGLFVGNPDARTLFPAEMVVDYVRVYEKEGGYAEAPPRGEGALPLE